MDSIHKQSDGRQTEDYTKEIVFLKQMVVPGMVGFVPGPEEAVHHIFVCPVGHKFPEEKSGKGDEGTNQVNH